MTFAEYQQVKASHKIEARSQEVLRGLWRAMQRVADGRCGDGTWIVVPAGTPSLLTGIMFSRKDDASIFGARRSCYVDFDLSDGDRIKSVGGIKWLLGLGLVQKRFLGSIDLARRNPTFRRYSL